MATTRKELQEARGPLNALIVRAMRRDGIREITKWADHHGIGRTTLYSVLRGRETASRKWVKPSVDTLIRLAAALDVPLHELIYLVAPDAPGANAKQRVTAGYLQAFGVERIPIEALSQAQSAGTAPRFAYAEPDLSRGRDLRAFRMQGDSMAAGRTPIHDDDVVLVDVRDKGSDAATVIARLLDGRYVCKVLKDDKFGRLLQSRNVDHTNDAPSAIATEDVAEIVGRVVRIIHDMA